jgi:putative ABC transport system ATP-binding protein
MTTPITADARSPLTPATEPLITMRGIKKVFLTDEVETHALAEVHLDVRQGEYVAISGPSGCGKTTLLSILGLLDTPSDGEYRLAGEPVSGSRRPTARACATARSASSSRRST